MRLELAKTKVSVDALAVGMFVSQLDRPWLETPLPFQGFLINSPKEIEQVKRYCDYVYVDIQKGIAPAKQYRLSNGEPETPSKPDNPYICLRKLVYEKSHQFEEELPQAKKLYQGLSKVVCDVMDGLHKGKLLDVGAIKMGVNAMLDSIIRNPTAFLWVNRLKMSDSYTYNHLITTSIWSAVFGRHLGLDRKDLEDLTLGGLLIDIGKAKLPTQLLYKTERLTEEEFELVKKHVDYGVRILAKCHNVPPAVLQIVATHHERWNGRGYPQGLREKAIPVFGRIVGLIDSFAAMTAPRPSSIGRSPHDTLSEFYENRGTYFEADLVEQFIQVCGIYPTGSLLELSSGEVAIVVGLEGTYRLRPRIVVILDEEKHPYSTYRIINLSKTHPELSVLKGLAPGAYGIDMEEIAL